MKAHDYGATGMFPFPADKAKCVYCREWLRKRHGLNRDMQGRELQTVMGWSLFGVAPYCVHCATKMWTDPDFFKRTGHSEHNALRWGLRGD